jgi:hypothetical protein
MPRGDVLLISLPASDGREKAVGVRRLPFKRMFPASRC